jgi:hypothetical protein
LKQFRATESTFSEHHILKQQATESGLVFFVTNAAKEVASKAKRKKERARRGSHLDVVVVGPPSSSSSCWLLVAGLLLLLLVARSSPPRAGARVVVVVWVVVGQKSVRSDRTNKGAGALVPRGLGWEISSAGVVYCSTVGTMMCKVPYSSCKVVTAHRESPQVPTVRLGGTVQYYAQNSTVQCHAVEL